jgi:hypothetical protein
MIMLHYTNTYVRRDVDISCTGGREMYSTVLVYYTGTQVHITIPRKGERIIVVVLRLIISTDRSMQSVVQFVSSFYQSLKKKKIRVCGWKGGW